MNWSPTRNSRIARCWALLAAVCLSLALPALAVTPTIVGGNGQMLALRADGTLWKWGGASSTDITTLRLFPEKIPGISGVAAVGVGTAHTVALLANGEVWTWGDNSQGQLGDGTLDAHTSPAKVAGLGEVVAIAVNGASNYAVKKDGTVWTWGANSNGELGMAESASVTIPSKIAGLADVIGIAACNGCAAAQTRDGGVWTWGANFSWQLGDGDSKQTPHWQPARIAISGVKRLIGGGHFFYAERNDGSVWAWGSNEWGQLADGTKADIRVPGPVSSLQGYTNITAGGGQAAGVAPDGGVRIWGTFPVYPYAMSSTIEKPTVIAGAPTRPSALIAGFSVQAALAADGTIWVWSGGTGSSYYSRPYPRKIANLANIAEISAGSAHSLALTKDGSVYAWGGNYGGQLGTGGKNDVYAPTKLSGLKATAVAACAEHNLVLNDAGEVLAWGVNNYGQLGDGTTTQNAVPTRISALSGMAALACGDSHSVALGRDGQVWEWGLLWSDSSSAVETATTPRLVAGLANIRAIAARANFTLALDADGAVYVWEHALDWGGMEGANRHRTPAMKMTGATRIAAGAVSAYAKSTDGRWYGWGANASNQFGLGKEPAVIDVPTPSGFGADVSEVVANGGSFSVNRIRSYAEEALGLTSSGTIIGLGSLSSVDLLKTGDKDFWTRNTPVVVNSLSGIRRLALGPGHTLALDANGEVWSWGGSSYGKLGEAPLDASQPTIVLDNDYATPFNLLTGRSFSAAATASGGNDALTLRATLTVADSDQGKPGKLYAAYQLPNGILFFQTAKGWVQFDGKAIPYLSETTLSEHNFTLWPGSAAGSLAGATFYVGYGQSEADLLDNRKYQAVHSVAPR